MATIVNTPSSGTSEGNNSGFLLGVILLAVLLFMFFYFGLPLLRGGWASGGAQVNVPGHVNVNVQKSGK